MRRLLGSRLIGQTAIFAVFNGLVSLLSAVASALLARHMTTDEFGSFSFALSFLLFTSIFFNFGWFLPAARLAAAADEEEQRRVVGASFLLYSVAGMAFAGSVFIVSFGVDSVFRVDAGDALRIAAPFSVAYPFLYLAHWLGQGTGRLYAYSITTALGQGLFVASLAGMFAAAVEVGATMALVLRGAAVIFGAAMFIVWARPVLRTARGYIQRLLQDAKEYGRSVWVGSVFAFASYRTDVLILGALTDASTVGFYVLATTLANASGLPLLGMSSALFPRMMRAHRIESRWLAIAWAGGLSTALVLWLFAHPFIDLVFSSRYAEAATFILPLGLAQALRGITGIYNGFLSTHARGRDLRNAGFVLGGASIVANFALIPPFGAAGAAWASLVAVIPNLAAHIVFYRRAEGELEDDISPSAMPPG